MKKPNELDVTSNRSLFNKLYKKALAKRPGGIPCSYCRYHRGENHTNKYYGGFTEDANLWYRAWRKRSSVRYPSWKLTSKNSKQWMPKQTRTEYEDIRGRIYIDIKFD